MSCILRAGGKNFDVSAFCAASTIVPDSVWQKGEKRFPNSTSNDAINDSSGIRLVASEADFSELSRQISDAVQYLRIHSEDIKNLASFPGVDGAVLDFGADIHPPGWSSFTFPAELLEVMGYAGVSLCLSVYPDTEETESDA